jgi:WD40 repeat protein
VSKRRTVVPGPYKGLVPYTEEDYVYFCGRDQQRQTIAANLKSSPVTTLFGPSGVGKSSVLAAGVLHDLTESARASKEERGRVGYLPVLFGRWQGDYRAGLAAEIRDRAAKLRAAGGLPTSGSFVQTCAAWIGADEGKLLLVLDQFEEFFLYHPTREDQLAWGRELSALIDRGVRVLLSLREDQLALLERLKPALPDVFANQLRVDHLDLGSARNAIEDPLTKWNETHGSEYKIDPDLTNDLLAELRPERMGGGSVASASESRVQAPWLQIVMTKLWGEEVQAGSSVLRIETLQRLQGVVRIAERHLDDQMGELSLPERVAAAIMFPRLVTPSGSKVLYPEADLIRRVWLFQPRAKAVLQRLSGEGRILEPIDSGGVKRYQIYHDQLGPAILSWRHRFILKLGSIAACTAFLLVAGAFAWVTLPGYFGARQQTREVTVAAAALASLQRPKLTSDVRRALALYAWAGSQNNLVLKPVAAEACAREFAKKRRFGFTKLSSVAFSPNAQHVALCGEGESVWLMQHRLSAGSTDNGYDVALLDTPATCRSVAFESKYLATGSEDGVIRVYNPDRGELLYQKQTAETSVNRVAINTNENLLATSGPGGPISIWEVGTGRAITQLKFHSSAVTALAFNPNRPELASADAGGHLEFWRTDQWGYRTDTLSAGTAINALQYNSETGVLVAGGADGSLRTCRVSSGCLQFDEGNEHDPIYGLGFVGVFANVVGREAGMQLWFIRYVKRFVPTPAVTALDVSSGGTRIVSVHADGTYRLWDAKLKEILNLPLTALQPVGPGGWASRSVIPVGDLEKGIVGSWDAAGQRVRLRLLGKPIESVTTKGPQNSVVVPYASSGQLPEIDPPRPNLSSIQTGIAGTTVSMVGNNWKEAARASPPPPLSNQDCKDLLGVSPCPPLPVM